MKLRPKVCFVTGGELPVPDVKGGAVERLLTMLIEDNEKEQKFEFTILSIEDEEQKALQKKFLHTHFVSLRKPQRLLNSIRWRERRLMEMITHEPYLHLTGINRQINQYLQKHGNEYDLIINECAHSLALKMFAERQGKSRLCRHYHFVEKKIEGFDDIYGSTISVSQFVKNAFMQHSEIPDNQNHVLLNCIDEKRFQKKLSDSEKKELRKSLGLDEDDFVILFCGRIIQIKGIKELVECVIKINEDKVKLLIMGSSNFGDGNRGVYTENVLNTIKNNSEKIKFTGFVPNNQIYKYLQISNVAANPSICEDACPLNIIENIVSGLPQIATISGGMTELGTSETTLFIHKDERLVKELTEAILYLKKNPEKLEQMRQACLNRAPLFYRSQFYNNFSIVVENIIASNG